MTGNVPPPGDFANAPQPDWEAIARFLAGESPADEATVVEQWLAEHPGDRALVERLNASVSPVLPTVDVEAALSRVHRRMDAPAAAPRLTLERSRGLRPRTIGVAAVLAAAAGFVAFVALRKGSPPGSNLAPAAPTVTRTFATKTGQRDSVRLADGSRIVLGPDSRLIVPADFGTAGRAVKLEGDGYFDVHHDAAKPFIVSVANGIVEDIGTTFTIESDAADATIVSVLSGSVRLRASSSPTSAGTVLGAGDRGSLASSGQVRSFENVVVSDDSAWTSGRLVFRDASIARVSGELRRWYGVGLFADASLLGRTVTTTIEQSQPIDQVLKILALTLGARVERQGDSATFHAQRGSSTVR